VLLHFEEQLSKNPSAACYDVSLWCSYFDQIDDLLEEIASILDKKKHTHHHKEYQIGGGKTIVYKDVRDHRLELYRIRWFVGARATAVLPGSYKLWKRHLRVWIDMSNNNKNGHPKRRRIISKRRLQSTFERALFTLHKMPRIWEWYLEWMVKYYGTTQITQTRRLFNRALTSLPVTQHDKIWKHYLRYVTPNTTTTTTNNNNLLPQETTLRVMRRHAHYFDPSAKESLVDVCLQYERYGEAAELLLDLINATTSSTTTTTCSRHDLWMKFSNLCTHHPTEIQQQTTNIDFDAIIRGVLQGNNNGWKPLLTTQEGDSEQSDNSLQFHHFVQEMEGTLWNQLAEYYVRQGEFDMARSIYEEGLNEVCRVRDFSILFDAYVKLEEGVVEAMMELLNEEDDEEEEEETASSNDEVGDWDILVGTTTSATTTTTASSNKATTDADMELALARAEHLTARRPLLLNRVLLRQNPHNVGEWLHRSELYRKQRDQTQLAIAALQEALDTVDAYKAVNGMPSQIVLQLASLYEKEQHDVDKARELYNRICNQHVFAFKHVDDLAQCHAAWVELELRQERWDDALRIARAAVASPSPQDVRQGSMTAGRAARRGLSKSLRLWDLLLDLEESLGTVATTKDSYDRAMELKVATPMHVLNFCSFLTDRKYFEESFTAYERGVELFTFPGVKLIWKSYLEAFVKRFGGTKMERARDLFERCVEACPPEECSEFYMMNGKFEEDYGLTKRALGVYKAMCQRVPPDEKYTAYQLYIAKTTKYMGVPATRDIYQEAISALKDSPAAQMCLDFAKMETSLQEIERARAVLAYGAQLADPRRDPEYWKAWHEFEVSHGNEETFREMLRVKRSVQAAFSTVNYNAAEMSAGSAVENLTDQEAMSMLAEREGVEVQSQTRVEGFVQQKRSAGLAQLEDVEDRVAKLRKATAGADVGPEREKQQEQGDDEIDLDDIEEEENVEQGSSAAVKDVSTKSVPAAVFGGLAAEQQKESSEEGTSMGARERLRAAAAADKDES
jgi:pre-mRNA-splicing factor SYF1